jgi:prophage regulatory protein
MSDAMGRTVNDRFTERARSLRPAASVIESAERSPVRPESTEARTAPLRLLRLAQVLDMTGLRKTKIYELQAAGQFPMRVKITAHCVGWIEQEVQAWLAGRIAASNSLSARAQPQSFKRHSVIR